MSQLDLPEQTIWGSRGPQAALEQVADLCGKALDLDIKPNQAGNGFAGQKAKPGRLGILACIGRLAENDVIAIELELVRCPGRLLVDAVAIFHNLADLSDRVRLLPPRQNDDNRVSLWAALMVAAAPMSMTRAGAFHAQLQRLDEMARQLQDHLPATGVDESLLKAYKGFADILALIPAWPAESGRDPGGLADWAREVLDLLEGGANLALASPHQAELDLALAMLSGLLLRRGSSLANLVPPAINAKTLVELAAKAPGVMVVPAIRLSLGGSPYELGGEVRALLASLGQHGRPVVFSGSFDQLQAVLHGGQGGTNDPLHPVVMKVPALPWDELLAFAIQQAGQLAGGLPQAGRDEVAAALQAEMENLPEAERRRLAPMLAAGGVRRWQRGELDPAQMAEFRRRLSGRSETFGGLSPRPRGQRQPQVQERLTSVLTAPDLLDYLRAELLGQDRALEELVARLRTEAMTRPLHQPLRYCAQGTPATGKSESAVLLARRLDVPYVNIDAASMPDFHTAASQLLGSGRGIVMSHLPGRLEQVAKHHAGCVVEISDLDHAPAHVRAPLADLFLQLLETGEAQSATGGMFSCANLVLAFTMNLPDGADEAVLKGIGFNAAPSRQEVQARVVKEIKRLLSGAFLSRMGRPILFSPLDTAALVQVVEQAVRGAFRSAASRFGLELKIIELAPGLGSGLLEVMGLDVVAFGARAILEHGRGLAAEAFLASDLVRGRRGPLGLRAFFDKEGGIAVEEI